MNDKLKHFIASAAITIAVLVIFAVIPHAYMWGYDKAIALFCGIFAGAIKEFVWDKWLGWGMFEWKDLENSLYGAFVGMFTWAIGETIVLAIL